jgi:hypothetical protein
VKVGNFGSAQAAANRQAEEDEIEASERAAFRTIANSLRVRIFV